MTRLWTATLVLALATIIGGAAAAANEQYTWAAADGTPFTVKDVSLHTDNPDGFSYDAVAPAAAIAACFTLTHVVTLCFVFTKVWRQG